MRTRSVVEGFIGVCVAIAAVLMASLLSLLFASNVQPGPFQAYSELTMTDNAVATTLPTQNAWVQITAGWACDQNVSWTCNAGAGTLTVNTGIPTLTYETIATGSINPGNSGATYELGVFKNGVLLAEHRIQFRAATTDQVAVTLSGIEPLAAGSVIDLRARCISRSTTSVTLLQGNFNAK